ncbi:lamin tail domain-containing protein 1 [Erinaceus europaeus]|uniref:Lamin tail domain-containing protein 1 n=1 Tax=Erinaceus europaeus TaxID=9365 RepID=A0ABM3XNX5_ERIEU|nr:lamin tail domain-containing protein 1 [Erinaceus europaeus]XP_060050526.1 lamin tail domain-containing protein 1 [Erinaceus europaeus]XP_060050527.1 lamin tail domain-containing protein 1 [Erinaceus europaeus]XP_060050528.1 lamin tail domain-containing protein 1 [Erinaceus europaeus]
MPHTANVNNLVATKSVPSCLQVEVYDLEKNLEVEAQGEDFHAQVPGAQRSFVHFFPEIADSSSTTLPLSLSVSELPCYYHQSVSLLSGLTVSTSGSKDFKSIVASRTLSETSQKNVDSTIQKKPSVLFHQKPAVIGEGEDYFLTLFGPSKSLSTNSIHAEKTWKHFSMILEDVGQSRYSAVGDIRISKLNAKGLFVKLINSSLDKELEIGNHILQQKMDGQTVCCYQFLPNIIMQAKSTVTVWAAASERRDNPPSDFLWKEQDKFCTSPNCATILCKPNGEAIAWYTPIHWKQAWEKLETDIEFNRRSIVSPTTKKHMLPWPTAATTAFEDDQDHSKDNYSRHHSEPGHASLKREKGVPVMLFPSQSPWCRSPSVPAHPYCSLIDPHASSKMGR